MQLGKPGVTTPGPGSHYNSQVPEREQGRQNHPDQLQRPLNAGRRVWTHLMPGILNDTSLLRQDLN